MPVNFLGIACVNGKIEVDFDGEPRNLDIQFSEQFEISQQFVEEIGGPPEKIPAEFQRHGNTGIIERLFPTYPNHLVRIEMTWEARDPLILQYPCDID